MRLFDTHNSYIMTVKFNALIISILCKVRIKSNQQFLNCCGKENDFRPEW